MMRSALPLILLLTLSLGLPACDRDDGDPLAAGGPAPPPPLLDASFPWAEGHHAALEELIRTHGKDGTGYDAEHPPVAVFDWDNTVIKNDIGNGTFYWFLQHDVYRAPPAGDWSRTSAHLTPAALAALTAACDQHHPDGTLATSKDRDCAQEMLTIYHDHVTTGGDPAWLEQGYDRRAFDPAYAWLAQLLAGYEHGVIRDHSRGAIDQLLSASEGQTQTVAGRDGLPGYVRIYEPMRDLIQVLQENGFDVWIVSASPEPIVQMFAERVGVPWDHVVGIRTLEGPDGKLTADLAGCGPVEDGGNTLIPYVEGKRCWIDKAIFGGPGRLESHPDAARRPVFVAGDAVTDIAMLHDATALRLVIDRHELEVLCHALAGTGGTWLIQPMFLEPLDARTDPYPCATTACRGRDGAPGPCLDASGAPLADQSGPTVAP